MFLANWFSIVALLLGLGLAGSFALYSFQEHFAFPLLVAPMFGLLFITLCTMTLYAVLNLPLSTALGSSFLALSALSGITLFCQLRKRRWRLPVFALLLIAAVGGVETILETSVSIKYAQPGMLLLDGTDELTYCHLADWLLHHRMSDFPRGSPENPYESIPNWIFSVDSRSGSYGFLASLSELTGQSPLFTYDLACAVALTCGICAVSAIFTKSKRILILICLGLLTSHWFDYSRVGFFAKTLSYPAIIFSAGLVLFSFRGGQTPLRIAILSAAAAGTAILQSGLSESLFLGAIAAAYLIFTTVFRDRSLPDRQQMIHCWVTLGLLIAIALLSTGTIARPILYPFIDLHLSWEYVSPRLADLENEWFGLAGLSNHWFELLVCVSAAFWICLGVTAIRCRSAIAAALIFGPMCILLAVLTAKTTGVAFQMIGTFYPIALCAAGALLDHKRPTQARTGPWPSAIALGIVIFCIAVHLPKTFGGIRRFCLNPPLSSTVLRSQIVRLQVLVGKGPLDVDVKTTAQLSLLPMIALGSQCQLQWSPQDWYHIFWYRGWPVPQYPDAAQLRLVASSTPIPEGYNLIYATNQYLLLGRR